MNRLGDWLRRNGVSLLVVQDSFDEMYRSGLEFGELPAEVFKQVRDHVHRCHVQMAVIMNDLESPSVSLALAGSSPWTNVVMLRGPPDYSADETGLPLLPGTRPEVRPDRMLDVILRSPTSKSGFAWMLEHAIDTKRLPEDDRRALEDLVENAKRWRNWNETVEVRGECFSAADVYDLTCGRPREIETLLGSVFGLSSGGAEGGGNTDGGPGGSGVLGRESPSVAAGDHAALVLMLHEMIASCIFAREFRSISASDRLKWSRWDDNVTVNELEQALGLMKQHFGNVYSEPLAQLASLAGDAQSERDQLLKTFPILAESGDVDWDIKQAHGVVRLPSPWAGMRAVDRLFARSASMSEKVFAWLREPGATSGTTAEALVAMALCRKTGGGASTALADALDGEMAVWHHALEGEERERVKATIVGAVRELSAGNANLMRPELEKARFDVELPVVEGGGKTPRVVLPWMRGTVDRETVYFQFPTKPGPAAFLRGQKIGLGALPQEVVGWRLMRPSDNYGADLIAVHEEHRVVVTVKVQSGPGELIPGDTGMARNKLRASRGSMGLESIPVPKKDGEGEEAERGVGLFGRRWLYVDVLAVTQPFDGDKFGSDERSPVREAWGAVHFAESDVREAAEWTRRQWDPEVSLVLSRHELRDMWPPELVLAGTEVLSDVMLCGEDAEDVVKKYSKQPERTVRPGLADRVAEKAKEEEEAKEREERKKRAEAELRREQAKREVEELEREAERVRAEAERVHAEAEQRRKEEEVAFEAKMEVFKKRDRLSSALKEFGILYRAVHLDELVDVGVTPELLRDAAENIDGESATELLETSKGHLTKLDLRCVKKSLEKSRSEARE